MNKSVTEILLYTVFLRTPTVWCARANLKTSLLLFTQYPAAFKSLKQTCYFEVTSQKFGSYGVTFESGGPAG